MQRLVFVGVHVANTVKEALRKAWFVIPLVIARILGVRQFNMLLGISGND